MGKSGMPAALRMAGSLASGARGRSNYRLGGLLMLERHYDEMREVLRRAQADASTRRSGGALLEEVKRLRPSVEGEKDRRVAGIDMGMIGPSRARDHVYWDKASR